MTFDRRRPVLTAFQPFLAGAMWPVGIVDAMTAQTIFDTERETATQTAQEGADLIRSHAPSVTPELEQLLLGSVARGVLQHTPCARDGPALGREAPQSARLLP